MLRATKLIIFFVNQYYLSKNESKKLQFCFKIYFSYQHFYDFNSDIELYTKIQEQMKNLDVYMVSTLNGYQLFNSKIFRHIVLMQICFK